MSAQGNNETNDDLVAESGHTEHTVLAYLRADPRGRMIPLYGRSPQLCADPRADGRRLAFEDSISMSNNKVVPGKLIATLLRAGHVELDGEGVVKLKGFTFVPIHGSFWARGIVGPDISLDEVIQDIADYDSSKEDAFSPIHPQGLSEAEMPVVLAKYRAFNLRMDILRTLEPPDGLLH